MMPPHLVVEYSNEISPLIGQYGMSEFSDSIPTNKTHGPHSRQGKTFRPPPPPLLTKPTFSMATTSSSHVESSPQLSLQPLQHDYTLFCPHPPF